MCVTCHVSGVFLKLSNPKIKRTFKNAQQYYCYERFSDKRFNFTNIQIVHKDKGMENNNAEVSIIQSHYISEVIEVVCKNCFFCFLV